MKLAPLLIAFALIGCKKSQPAPPPPPAPKPTLLEIVSPGAEPRRVLRYALAKGTKTTMELAMDVALTAGTLGGSMPTLVVTLDLEVLDVLPDGRMKLRTTIADVTARDRPDSRVAAATMSGALKQLDGIAIAATLSPDGRLSDASVDTGNRTIPAQVAAQLRSLTTSFEQVAMPLPTPPIGVGAKWKSTRTVEQNGMAMTTISTIDVTALDGNKLSFSVGSEIHGPDQTVQQNGTPVDVKNLHGAGTGHGTIDLDRMAMTAEFSATFESEMEAQGKHTPMKLQMKMEMTPR